MGNKRSHQLTRTIKKNFPAEADTVLGEKLIESEAGSAYDDVSGSEAEYMEDDESEVSGCGSEADDGFSDDSLADEVDEFDLDEVEASASDKEEGEKEDEDSIEDLKKKKKPKKTTEAVDLGAAISSILGEKTKVDAAPILARRKGIERKLEDEKLEAKARAVLKKQRLARKDAAHVSVPDMSFANYERQLKKAATKGVVQLFNAIHQHQVMKEKLAKEKLAAGAGKKAEVAAQIKQISKTSFLDMLKGGSSAQLKKPAESQ